MNRFINTRLTVDNGCFAPEFPVSSSDTESSPESNKENNTHNNKNDSSQRSLSLWSTIEKPNHDLSLPVSVKQAKLCFENLANKALPLTSRPAFQRRSRLPENNHVSCVKIVFNVRHLVGYVTLNPG